MTQDEHRDDAAQRDDETRQSRGWRNLGGLSGRLRRQSHYEPEHEAPRKPAPGNEPDTPLPPVVPARPAPPLAGMQTARPNIGQAVPDDGEAEEAVARPDPHPDLHPALRRDQLSEPDEADDELAAAEGTDAPAAANLRPPTTGTTSTPVVEERIALTPRPTPPAPESPATEAVGAAEVAEVPPQPPAPAGIPAESASLDEIPEDVDLIEPYEPPSIAASASDADESSAALARRTTTISAYLAVLAGVATMAILAFVLIEPTPRWLLILGAGAVVLGLDGTLRQTWREPFTLGQETAPFLFVPALYMLSVPVIIEHNFAGEVVVLAGLGAGLGFGALAWAELASVRAFGPDYPQARTIVTANTYLAGFAVFSLTYVFNISLPAAIAATGIAAAMLAVEVLREGEIDPMETLGLALVTGVVLAEARWLFYYMPLDTYLAGLSLLLVFYLCTGLLHSHIVRAMRPTVVAQYGGIAAAGFALVIFARSMGLA